MLGDLGWCTTCRRRKRIVDQHDEAYYDNRDEMVYLVTEFECGHESLTEPRVIGASPGGESVAEDQAQRATAQRLAGSSLWQEKHG